MELVKRDSVLWYYLTDELKGLIETGEQVLSPFYGQSVKDLSDYSFLVFSFSKAYEGFLKKLFLDMGLIREHEYYSDDIRIGRILNPFYLKEHNNVFVRICDHTGEGRMVSQKLWDVWKRGRNLVFHYFPHNFRKLSYAEAFATVLAIIDAMDTTVTHCVKTAASITTLSTKKSKVS